MKIHNVIFFFFLTTSITYSQNYKIDPGHTAVLSKVTRFGIVKVVGRFTDVSGKIYFDANALDKTSADIIIKTESYNANNPEGEKAIKSKAFLDAATFPEIKIAVSKVIKNGNTYSVTASVTLHGQTKEITFPASIAGPGLDAPTGKQSIGIAGNFTLNRQDFGIAFARKLPNGNEVVSNDVEVEVNILAIAE